MTANKRVLSMFDIVKAAKIVAANILSREEKHQRDVKLYGIPRGGIPAAFAVAAQLESCGLCALLVDNPHEAHYIIDDLWDSGETARSHEKAYRLPVLTLFKKVSSDWLVFPWEQNNAGEDTSADDIGLRILQRIGEDVSREGLRETPARFVKALDEKFSGYKQSPLGVLKAFEDGAAESSNGLVIVSDIPVYSTCEHHLETIFGTATIGYIPRGLIVGLSKMKRLVDVFARRLQVQERLTNQIADTLDTGLGPLGVGVIIRARHMCMEARGIKTPGSFTTTSALRGALLNNPVARQEFMELAK